MYTIWSKKAIPFIGNKQVQNDLKIYIIHISY